MHWSALPAPLRFTPREGWPAVCLTSRLHFSKAVTLTRSGCSLVEFVLWISNTYSLVNLLSIMAASPPSPSSPSRKRIKAEPMDLEAAADSLPASFRPSTREVATQASLDDLAGFDDQLELLNRSQSPRRIDSPSGDLLAQVDMPSVSAAGCADQSGDSFATLPRTPQQLDSTNPLPATSQSCVSASVRCIDSFGVARKRLNLIAAGDLPSSSRVTVDSMRCDQSLSSASHLDVINLSSESESSPEIMVHPAQAPSTLPSLPAFSTTGDVASNLAPADELLLLATAAAEPVAGPSSVPASSSRAGNSAHLLVFHPSQIIDVMNTPIHPPVFDTLPTMMNNHLPKKSARYKRVVPHPSSAQLLIQLPLDAAQERRRTNIDNSKSYQRSSYRMTMPPPKRKPWCWIPPCVPATAKKVPSLIHQQEDFRSFCIERAGQILYNNGDLSLTNVLEQTVQHFDNVFIFESPAPAGSDFSGAFAALAEFGKICIFFPPGSGLNFMEQILHVPVPAEVFPIINRPTSFGINYRVFRDRLDIAADETGPSDFAAYATVLARLLSFIYPSYLVVSRQPNNSLLFELRKAERMELIRGQNNGLAARDLHFESLATWSSSPDSQARIFQTAVYLDVGHYRLPRSALDHFIRLNPLSISPSPQELAPIPADMLRQIQAFFIRASDD